MVCKYFIAKPKNKIARQFASFDKCSKGMGLKGYGLIFNWKNPIKCPFEHICKRYEVLE